MRSRCGDLPEKECESRVAEARRLALEAGARPQLVFPDSGPEDWLDCGQCRDCFKPAFSQRPRETVQYAMSLSNPKQTDSAGRPSRFRFGFIASSDNHTARPGTGYKQVSRRAVMTEASGPRSRFFLDRFLSQRGVSQPDPQRASPAPATPLFGAADFERTTSFLYPGGLAAVHAEGRSRKAIWEALGRKEVYGTSGPRILLWFDLLNDPQGRRPMGSEAEMQANPRFEVRAIGSRTQKPGCPESSQVGLTPERLEKLCKGECYNPSDRRHAIRAIEVVRIRPQTRTGEDLGLLIEDPWRRFECEPNKQGCVVRFEDPAFRSSGRDALYYVRALQEETPAINGRNLNTRFDASGNPVAIFPCYGDFRTPFQDDCLAPVQERAWSSPIFIDQPR